MDKKVIVQKIKVNDKDSLSTAIRYFSILSAISSVKLSEREIQLLAFTLTMGNISYSPRKQEFCTMYNSSINTVNNIVSKLKKMGLMVKDRDMIKVAPQYSLDFNKDTIIQISLLHG